MRDPEPEIRALVQRNRGQMTADEYRAMFDEIQSRAPSRVVIFGCGRDSFLWSMANVGGETLFLEHDMRWIASAEGDCKARGQPFQCALVKYTTTLADWAELIDKHEMLEVPFIRQFAPADVVLVDGPQGEGPRAHGRMQSIFMASQIRAPGGTVCVHDMHRRVETVYGERYLGKISERVGKLGIWR